jgi:hypothetical protein
MSEPPTINDPQTIQHVERLHIAWLQIAEQLNIAKQQNLITSYDLTATTITITFLPETHLDTKIKLIDHIQDQYPCGAYLDTKNVSVILTF